MKQFRSFALLGATAIVASALAITPAMAQTTAYPITTKTAPRAESVVHAQQLTAAGYAYSARSSSLYEYEISKLGVERAQNEQVRLFAQQVLDDHSSAIFKMNTAVQQAGVASTAAVLSAPQATKLDNLRKMSIAGFDKLYAQTQMESHETALDLHRRYSQGGDQPMMRGTSAELASVAEEHIAAGRKISTLLASES
ncbi:MAG: DUF4142 domain-containing protein [Ferrovibrio sp.]